jgi:hypothetical protein
LACGWQRFLTPHGRGGADGGVLVLDSTNGGPEGRGYARKRSAARRVIFVQLRDKLAACTGAEAVLEREEWLLCRAAGRAAHPAFPPDEEPDRQRQKIQDVLSGLEWAEQGELSRAYSCDPAAGGEDGLPGLGPGLVVECDPADTAQLSDLPYRVWLEIFVAGAVRHPLGL